VRDLAPRAREITPLRTPVKGPSTAASAFRKPRRGHRHAGFKERCLGMGHDAVSGCAPASVPTRCIRRSTTEEGRGR
jgi:hypothetical protein